MTMILSDLFSGAVFLLSLLSSSRILVMGFANPCVNRIASSFVTPMLLPQQYQCKSRLGMGLYDTPLPPRPSPRNDGDDGEKSAQEGDMVPESTRKIFRFQADGTEVNGYLPPLGRSLALGIDCYYESSDRKVQLLVQQTNCHPEDAAWALEACEGDGVEAWTRISTARRLILEQESKFPPKQKSMKKTDATVVPVEEETLQDDDRSAEETLSDFRKQLKELDRKQKIQDYFSGGKADEDWLPTKNPRPIDDEPWFTG